MYSRREAAKTSYGWCAGGNNRGDDDENRHNDGDVVDELDATVVKHWRLEFPRMNDLTATGTFRPYFSSGLRFVVDQELRCWDTVLAPRTNAEC